MAEQTTGPQAAKPRTYTDEYRRQVVDMVTATGQTAMSVAAELAETRSVCGWARVGDVPRVPGVGGETAGLRRGRALRLARQAGTRAGGGEQGAAGRHSQSSCRKPAPLRQPARACGIAGTGEKRRPWPHRTPDARPWRAKPCGAASAGLHNQHRHAFPVAPPASPKRRRRLRLDPSGFRATCCKPPLAAPPEGRTAKPSMAVHGQQAELGWSMREHLRAALATPALMMATQRQRPEPGLIQHSDQGYPICLHGLPRGAASGRHHALHEPARGNPQGPAANAFGVSAMPLGPRAGQRAHGKLFFHTLKTELVHHRAYVTHDEARRDLFAYVERFSSESACTRA